MLSPFCAYKELSLLDFTCLKWSYLGTQSKTHQNPLEQFSCNVSGLLAEVQSLITLHRLLYRFPRCHLFQNVLWGFVLNTACFQRQACWLWVLWSPQCTWYCWPSSDVVLALLAETCISWGWKGRHQSINSIAKGDIFVDGVFLFDEESFLHPSHRSHFSLWFGYVTLVCPSIFDHC